MYSHNPIYPLPKPFFVLSNGDHDQVLFSNRKPGFKANINLL